MITQPWDQVGALAPALRTADAGSKDQMGKNFLSIPTMRPNTLKGSLEKYSRPHLGGSSVLLCPNLF